MKKFWHYVCSDLNRDISVSLKVKFQIFVFRLGFYGYHRSRNTVERFLFMRLYGVLKLACYMTGVYEMPYVPVFIDEGLRVPHGFGSIVLSQYARIGKNATIFHNVTIGAMENEVYKSGDISIGDNVYIACGATILGKCLIGDNVKIGANALIINQIVEANSIIFAPKAQVVDGHNAP